MAPHGAPKSADKTPVDELTREFVAESREGLDRMERSLTELELRPQDRPLLDEIFRAVHTIKGSAGFLGFGRLEALAHAGETLLSSLRTGRITATAELITGLLELLDSLRSIIRLIELTGGEGQRKTDEDFATVARLMELNEAGRVSAALGREVGGAELHRNFNPGTAENGAVTPDVEAADRIERRASAHPGDKSIRVDIEVLNQLMNQVGELVLTRNQLLRVCSSDIGLSDIARRMDTITSELRETTMRLRLQPVGNLFGKFPRLVRDLARACGKEVRLEVEGQGTGLDKSLLEAIRDPLTHALRNAIDHGIEAPRERLQAGKNAEGLIRLRAFHQNGCVIVELTDDGAGICAHRVAAKAVERGLLSAEGAAGMSEQECIEFVFTPGLSTAAEVTNLSGRGVGMDIIRADVEAAGGRVRLDSIAGRGTTLRFTLPLTLAIVPALVVRSAELSFAIPQSALAELIYIPAGALAPEVEAIGDQELFPTRSGLVPLLRLDSLLELTTDARPDHGHHLALLEHEGSRVALLVDEIVAPEEVVVKPVSAVLRRSGHFSGAAILGSGELALILDVAGLRAAAGLERKGGVAKSDRHRDPPGPLSHGEPILLYEIAAPGPEGPRFETRVMPLSSVERVDVVQLDQIERVGGRTALRLGGSVIEVSGDGSVPQSGRGEVTALICTRGASRHAVLVSRVLGLSEDPVICGGEDGRLAVVHDRVALFQEPVPFEPVLGVA